MTNGKRKEEISGEEIINYFTKYCKIDSEAQAQNLSYGGDRDLIEEAYINQKTEIERLKLELSYTRRKVLLEASSKFAGHSNYHGDTILGILICMAEGKEVSTARPLDMSEMKIEAYKAFAEHLKEKWSNNYYDSPDVDFDEFVDNLLIEMLSDE